MTPSVIVVGGGLAGLSAAAALGDSGFDVELHEARGFLGGRATSFPVSPSDENSEVIDNCQHVLLRCCVNLLDFYRRMGVLDRVRFSEEFYFISPGAVLSRLRRGALPAPLHLAGSFLGLRFLDLRDKLSIARGLFALRREHASRKDLDGISMLDWLREKRQTQTAIDRFWRQVLVSAVNEELDYMARNAATLYRALRAAAERLASGARPIEARLAALTVLRAQPSIRVEYLEIVDPDSMRPVDEIRGPVRIAAAVWIGETRLIDNVLQ